MSPRLPIMFRGNCTLQFASKSTLFVQDSDSVQIVYSQSSMSIRTEIEPEQK